MLRETQRDATLMLLCTLARRSGGTSLKGVPHSPIHMRHGRKKYRGWAMSRSYRHHHIVKDHTSGKPSLKACANRAVRNVPIELTDTLQGKG